MKVQYRFGKLNDKKKEFQNINIRIYHSKLDFRGSLGWEINIKEWDFKEMNIIDLSKGNRTPDRYKYLSGIKNDLHKIRTTFETEFNEFSRTNLSSVSSDEWGNWCKNTLTKAIGGPKEERSRFIEKMEQYIEHLKKKKVAPSTLRSYREKKTKIVEFQSSINKIIYTDEIDLNFYNKFKDFCSDCGISDNTFGDYIKKIKAVISHFRSDDPSFKYHVQIDSKDFKVLYSPREGNVLPISEIEKIYSYKGKPELENVAKLGAIQYHMCWRISDLKENIKQYYEGNAEIHFNGDYYVWHFKEIKKIKKGAVAVPVHRIVREILSDNQLTVPRDYNKLLRTLLKELGIKTKTTFSSHDFRKSFCTNMYMIGKPLQDIMQYSGHDSEDTLLIYINKKASNNRVNSIPTE